MSPAQLVSEVKRDPPAAEPRCGAATTRRTTQAKDTDSFLSVLQKILLAFGGVILFVAAFVIVNSLSITIAQRTRELATLRTLGASRRQVLRSVILEALVMGTLASVIGLFLGLALAKGLFKLFDSVGFTLPNNGLVFQTRTVIFALAVGIGVTVLASLWPAFRATRVPPIAAVREGATLPPGRFARYRPYVAALLAMLGFAALAYALFSHGLGTTNVLFLMITGALLIFIGVALFSSSLVGPAAAAANPVARWSVFVCSRAGLAVLLAAVLAAPLRALGRRQRGPPDRRIPALRASPAPALCSSCSVMALRKLVTHWRPEWPVEFPTVLPDGSTTRIGAENSRRNPQRTASTAAALMIGLALVTLVATLAAGIIQPFRSAVNELFTADYSITAQNNFSPIPPSAALPPLRRRA